MCLVAVCRVKNTDSSLMGLQLLTLRSDTPHCPALPCGPKDVPNCTWARSPSEVIFPPHLSVLKKNWEKTWLMYVVATSRLGHSLVFDSHSCFLSLVPPAVTVNCRGDVGSETNSPPGPTLRNHGHVKNTPETPARSVSKSKLKRICDNNLRDARMVFKTQTGPHF